MNATPWDCDVVALLERAVLAGGSTTAHAALHIDTAREAARRGWVTNTARLDGVEVTITGPGAAYLDQLYGPGWDSEVRAVRAALGVA